MELFALLIRTVRRALPLPDLDDNVSMIAWWEKQGPSFVEIVGEFRKQFAKTGRVVMELSTGETIVFAESGRCMAVNPLEAEAKLMAQPVEAFGDGKIRDFILKWLPIIIKFLPLILDTDPAPSPEPEPNPTPEPDEDDAPSPPVI